MKEVGPQPSEHSKNSISLGLNHALWWVDRASLRFEKKTEKTINILPVFFEPKWSPMIIKTKTLFEKLYKISYVLYIRHNLLHKSSHYTADHYTILKFHFAIKNLFYDTRDLSNKRKLESGMYYSNNGFITIKKQTLFCKTVKKTQVNMIIIVHRCLRYFTE